MSERKLPISQAELVSLLAMLSATIAFSLDAMLPALPAIASELSADAPNRAQLIIGAFVLGLGLGTFFAGPLCDAFGRKTIAVIGAVVYTIAAIVAAFAADIELLLIARLIQGIGASGPRVAAMAITRDLFSGRRMAQILSYIIFVFTLTPIFAPTLGWLIEMVVGWRGIFASFALFAIISMAWLLIRLPETLAEENLRPFRPSSIIAGTREVFGNHRVMLAMGVQTLVFGCLFAGLTSSQQVFGEIFDKPDSFPLWFGLMAVIASTANLINARAVIRLGMREMVRRALLIQGGFTMLFLMMQVTGTLSDTLAFPITFLWLTSIFFLAGFGLGNMNALALEPLGHMAGLAASIVTAIATIGAAVLSVPIGLAFDGTTLPLTVGVMCLVGSAYLLLRQLHEEEDTAPQP